MFHSINRTHFNISRTRLHRVC